MAASSAQVSESRDRESFIACTVQEIKKRGRIHIQTPLSKRRISLISDKGQIFAMDSICYHMGGPLTLGDIEDIAGERCIVCPWHKHPVSLKTGHKLSQGVEFIDGRPVRTGWKPGQRVAQRTHTVSIDKKDNVRVFVNPESAKNASSISVPSAAGVVRAPVPSDDYAFSDRAWVCFEKALLATGAGRKR